MTSEEPTVGAARGPWRLRRVSIGLAVLAMSLAALGLAVFNRPASARAATECPATSSVAPIIGSWYAEVNFPGFPFAGKTEATMITFTPGGGVVEANPINKSPAANSGFWRRNADCTYSVRLLNFTWDPVLTGMTQVLDVQLTFVMDDLDHFHSTGADAVVYAYDPQTGQRLGDPIAIPNVTRTTAQRFNTWVVPDHFPAQP
jgi:hypothetical protein